MTKFTKPFPKISKKDVAIAGGKGASLGEMTNAKIPVPKGFVILAEAFDHFLNETPKSPVAQTDLEVDALLAKVNFDDTNSIDKASNVIRDIMHDTKMPKALAQEIAAEFKKLKTKYVAVRSSATAEDSSIASWAGELETYLHTTEKTLLDKVKHCWSSLYTPRAIFYRYEKKLIDQQVSVAVVVQEMVESEISGVAFTVHPVTKAKNQMIIEAGFGLGEAIVSGQITPDSYIVDKTDLSILDINVAEQKRMLVRKSQAGGIVWKPVAKAKQESQVLSGKQIIELSKICINIEKHYKCPQDIEWAYTKGKFYITQSRPITTL
ncbi:MAG: PEP/pyruvate-binding domain-containing protein [Patescibacteria group bacterium]|jgi:pyruvate,water dikinase|nr:PEP/pyruvate-binding domain-containing protein [Patescibacteria group bacterium]